MGHLVGFQKKQKSILADGTLHLVSKKPQLRVASREDQSTQEMVSLPAFFENKTSDQLKTIKKQIKNN
jgi:hypothetical protein